MSEISPYKLFWNWVFDWSMKTSIPKPEVLLKYNTPITPVFLLKSMIKIGKLNYYLNSYMNNIGIYSIDKEELFLFFKKAVLESYTTMPNSFWKEHHIKSLINKFHDGK